MQLLVAIPDTEFEKLRTFLYANAVTAQNKNEKENADAFYRMFETLDRFDVESQRPDNSIEAVRQLRRSTDELMAMLITRANAYEADLRSDAALQIRTMENVVNELLNAAHERAVRNEHINR